jgi:hypothetical protein
MPEVKFMKQELIYLLDRINAPSYVDLMISLLCKAVNNISPYEDDQYNAARYRRIYDLLSVIKNRRPKWKLVYLAQDIEAYKQKADVLNKVYRGVSFFVQREIKKENHFRLIYETINSIDITKNYTKNFKWFKELKSNLKFVYDRSPKWALNYQEPALPDLGNLTENDFN